jgi:hypothetical protein
MFLLYRLSPGAPIWPIGVGGPRVLPVWAHSSYATGSHINPSGGLERALRNVKLLSIDQVCTEPVKDSSSGTSSSRI